MRALLLSVSVLSLLPSTAIAAEPLEPRLEGSWRAGTERNIYVSEFWVPIMQDEGGVLYGDIRFMGDSDDGREFNAGLGYREMVNSDVLGKGVIGVWRLRL